MKNGDEGGHYCLVSTGSPCRMGRERDAARDEVEHLNAYVALVVEDLNAARREIVNLKLKVSELEQCLNSRDEEVYGLGPIDSQYE